ncbi:outer membrane beta-barrel protein, partial [Bacteroides acidifaciens]
MKKILVLFALLMTGVMGIHAQEGLKWGAMAGMNSSKFSTDGFDSKVGFHAGIKAEKDLPQIAQGVYLDMAALLSLKGAQVSASGASLKINPYYLEIPIHMGYKHAVTESISLFANFGPYFAVGLFGKMKETDYSIDEVGGFTNIYDSASAFGDNALKRFDFGLGLKAG